MFSIGDESNYAVIERSVLETLVDEALSGGSCFDCQRPVLASTCEGDLKFYVRSSSLNSQDPGIHCNEYIYKDDN